jgi:hypothetical protein
MQEILREIVGILEFLAAAAGFLLMIGLAVLPLFIIALLITDWGRAERIEEAIAYEPEPGCHPDTRFCAGDEMRKRGW